MNKLVSTIILRHRKENLKKCSLRGLESRTDCLFLTYPVDPIPDLSSFIILTLDAPLLSADDRDYGLFLVDATWRYAAQMCENLPQGQRRSLPRLKTAYPRYQTGCSDPDSGLASIEALYAAYLLTGRDPAGLLDRYHWREAFLKNNEKFFGEITKLLF